MWIYFQIYRWVQVQCKTRFRDGWSGHTSKVPVEVRASQWYIKTEINIGI
jgi:hypothetical protein